MFFFSRMRGRGDKRKKHGEVGKAELKRYRKTLSDRGFRPTADAPFVPMSQDVVDNFQRKQAAKNPDIPLPPEISHPVRVRHWGPKRRRVAVVPEKDYVVEEPAADVQDVHDVHLQFARIPTLLGKIKHQGPFILNLRSMLNQHIISKPHISYWLFQGLSSIFY